MNCIKCGKELEENEKELCKDCAKVEKKAKKEKKENPKTENKVKETKDVLEEIIEEEKNEKVVEEEKKEKKTRKKKEEKVEEVKEEIVKEEKAETVETTEEVKEEKKEGKKHSKVVNVLVGLILAALIIVVTVLCVLKLMTPDVGATIGNIRNYGYSVADNGWIYFMSFDESGEKVTLNKIKQNGTKQQELASDNWTILSLNVENGWLYFIGLKEVDATQYTAEELVGADLYDNKIYKIKTNGDGLEVINDNEFDDESYEIYVVDGRIYYQGTDGLLYSMDTNGEDRRKVIDTACTPVGITDKYIFYTKTKDDGSEATVCMNLDGTNEKEINGSRLYSLNVVGDDVYYVKEDLFVYKTSLTNGGEELISDTVSAYNMVADGDWIYYLNYIEEEEESLAVGIYRMKNDGTEITLLKKLSSYSSFLNVVGNWIYYTDSDEQFGYVKILKLDGSEEKTLYSLDFYSSTEVPDEQITTEGTTEETTENQ